MEITHANKYTYINKKFIEFYQPQMQKILAKTQQKT